MNSADDNLYRNSPRAWSLLGRVWVLGLLLLLSGAQVLAGEANPWVRLEADGLHDPKGGAIRDLQQPGEALAPLPRDVVGNMVRWVEALRTGVITPRTNILPDTKIQVLDLDIIYPNTGNYNFVRFPHKAHTEWLDCSNCHDAIFAKKYRGTTISMANILEGRQCGQCHGAVSFPLTECNRCHSVDSQNFAGKFGPQPVAK
ncbi:MAG: hypothetical protein HQL88_01725 [Magnetococcales bacterium]|nr:hypothetical protein [Magnetococcales bacterium]